MNFSPPSTEQIKDLILNSLSSKLGQTIPILPKAFLNLVAVVLAGALTLCYKLLGWVLMQMFVSKASYDSVTVLGETFSPLIEWGRLLGVGDPAAPVATEMELEFPLIASGTVPSGTLVNGPDGQIYRSTSSVLASSSPVTIPVICVVTGTSGNLAVGAVVTLANPSSVISASGVVSAITVDGAEQESEENYRQRVVDRFQKPPRGSAYADYEMWAEEPVGIRAAYPYASELYPGQVEVYVESATTADGIPTTAQLESAYDSLHMASRRQANEVVAVLPITRKTFDVEINGLVVDSEADTQAAILEALTAYFKDRAPFIGGLTVPPREDLITVSAVTGVVSDVVEAYNGVFASAILKQGGSQVQVYSLLRGELAKLGTVTYL